MLRFRLSAAAAATAAIAWMPAPPVVVSGLDPAGFDRTVAPEDDLYRHVNGGWLARAAVPVDRVTYGAFDEIADRTDLDLRSIIEGVSARPNRPRGSTLQQIADL
ncbi:MAG TPA: hypothetical protein VEL79_20905, partial [Vicinamibacterales bacterium]|nr:hypothetical protein [Vicinamibacterales bacterium]